MIDTIVLRIHNIKNYEKTYNYFFSAKKSGITTAYVDENTGEYFENRANLATVFHDSLRSIPLVHRSSIFLPSSHYSVSYSINITRDFFEFNFSIPKFLFSTNVMQFISYYNDTPSGTWTIFLKFIEDFFITQFPEKIIREDIEIHRLDICYNQFFDTKDHALEYLEKQKDLVRKYARTDYNTYRPATYRTSWELISKRYKFKAYHKGTEFREHDYKELTRDKQSNPKNLDLQYFLDQSDRIIRYELTLRHTYFNYLFQKIYFETDTASDYYNYGDGGYRNIFNQCIKAALKFKGKTGLEKFFTRTKHFMLSSILDHSTDPVAIIQSEHVTFNRNFWYCCYDQFYKMLHKFQLDRLLSIHEVAKKVDDMNESADLKNSLRRGMGKVKDKPRLVAYAMLAQYVPVDDLKGYMNKRSFMRMKADLRTLGIGDTSRLSTMDMPLPRTDYWDYKLTFSKFHNVYI